MGGRGRGRGGRGGANKSFSKEQLSSLGIGGVNDGGVGMITQPPLIYPLMDRKPVPITPSPEMDYLLLLRQDYIDHMQLSPAHIKLLVKSSETDHEIDKLVAQIPSSKAKFNWNLLPVELRPKVIAKRIKTKIKKEVDIVEQLNKLEELEKTTTVTIKEEVDETEADKEEGEAEAEVDIEVDPEDEEMDDGTDYANNYFDNGEAYEDEDDNLDDGPIY